MFDYLIHRIAKKPYHLTVTLNEIHQKEPTVVLLHGIASSSKSWSHVIARLPSNISVCAIDLLGFGQSPKPKWKTYNAHDHAHAVVATIKKLGIKGPIILVGHSMGGIIAVEIAKKRHIRVSNLVLVATPLYKNTPLLKLNDGLVEVIETSAYRTLYGVLAGSRFLSIHAAQLIQRHFPSAIGFEITKKTWISFKKSLTSTIENQTTLADMQRIKNPVTLLLGKKDPFVIATYQKELSKKHRHIELQIMEGAHELNRKNAAIITNAIISAVDANR